MQTIIGIAMNSQDETTVSQYTENDNDKLLLLTGVERLRYFSEKPDLKKKNITQQLLHFFKK